MLEDGYDLAIRVGNLNNSSLISRKLSSTKMIVAASPKYLSKHGTPYQPNDLKQHKIIMCNHWAKKEQWNFYQDNICYAINLNADIYCNNDDTCRQIMLHHGGISKQPDFIIGDDIKEGCLSPILSNYEIKDLNIYAIYSSRKLLTLRTRCLIDFLIIELKSLQW